jgi:hypothetical protein
VLDFALMGANISFEQFMYAGAVAYRVSEGPTLVDVIAARAT